MQVTRRPHWLFELPLVVLRALIVVSESIIPFYPDSSFWLDYISINRTCPVDNLPRTFGLMPARFTYRLDYLKRKPWASAIWNSFVSRTSETTKKVLETIRTFRN